jgi:hypothetical protein
MDSEDGLIAGEPFPYTHGYRFAYEGGTDVKQGAILQGDFTMGGSVNEDDYLLWKQSFGMTGELAADANGDGVVDAADYTVWRDNFVAGGLGQSPTSEVGSALPEPSTLISVVLACIGLLGIRSR